MRLFYCGLAGILLSFCTACETDPVIYDDHPPKPVIYGIFNKDDTYHYLKVGKSFGAEKDPLISAQVYDSLFFTDLEVNVYRTRGDTPVSEPYVLEAIDSIPKEAGLFHFPGQRLYRFEANTMRGGNFIRVEVTVPGLPKAIAQVSFVDLATLTTPKKAQQYLYLVPTSPLRVHWLGNAWNEIDVIFEFIEDFGDSRYQSRFVHIQNINYFDSPHDRYREMKITYEEFIKEVLQQIQPNDSVKETFFGHISIIINGGDENMVQYMKYMYGYNDFNTQEFSNIENGVGLLASRSTFTKDSLRFDYETRQTLINENRLKVLKISPRN